MGVSSVVSDHSRVREKRHSFTRTLVTAGLALMLIGGGTLSANAAEVTTKANLWAQEKSQWCWVATSKTVVNHYKNTFPSQCALYGWGKAVSGCSGNQPGSFTTDVQRALQGASMSNYGAAVNGQISHSHVKTEINNNRVVMVRWGWKSTGLSTGHMVVLSGYNTTNTNVQTVNPAGSGSKLWKSYAWLSDDGSHQWTHTRYLILG